MKTVVVSAPETSVSEISLILHDLAATLYTHTHTHTRSIKRKHIRPCFSARCSSLHSDSPRIPLPDSSPLFLSPPPPAPSFLSLIGMIKIELSRARNPNELFSFSLFAAEGGFKLLFRRSPPRSSARANKTLSKPWEAGLIRAFTGIIRATYNR